MRNFLKQAPLALFDTLENMANPYRQPVTEFDYLKSDILPQQALDDYQHASEFLYSYRGSAETFKSYRREIERLLQWAWLIEKKSLAEIKRSDIELFIEFCQTPPKPWIGVKQASRFINKNGLRIPNSDWRPFVVTASKASQQQKQDLSVKDFALSQNALKSVFAVLGSFFNYLIQEEYVGQNPVAQVRQKSKFLRKHQTNQQIRRLSELQWNYVIETAELMASEEPENHERTLFIMNCLYGMYLRISELVVSERWAPQMGDFSRDQEGNWWFTTVGKGNKERLISVSNAMLDALKRYRLFRQLSALPHVGETTALIARKRGRGGITSTRQIRFIVQHCFDRAIQRMKLDDFQEDADRLAAATVHWLRHTGISEDVKHRPREHVRDDAGHGSSAITDRYIDIDLRERHASARKKTIKPS